MTPPRPTHTPYRKFRISDDLWQQYGDVVGHAQRSADLRAYVEWRIANPDRPLPGRSRKRPAENQ